MIGQKRQKATGDGDAPFLKSFIFENPCVEKFIKMGDLRRFSSLRRFFCLPLNSFQLFLFLLFI